MGKLHHIFLEKANFIFRLLFVLDNYVNICQKFYKANILQLLVKIDKNKLKNTFFEIKLNFKK